MKIISNSQYKEYQDLIHWAKKQKVWESAMSIKKLEDDIDLPIKKCVAMCALLGFNPVFSCCGFDYEGQPYHKYHQYDMPYIMISENSRTLQLLELKNIDRWFIRKHVTKTIIIELLLGMNPSWRSRECIHSSEECSLAIPRLEKFLLSHESQFLDNVILEDTNQNYKKQGIRFWQYPPKEPWHIKKEFLDAY